MKELQNQPYTNKVMAVRFRIEQKKIFEFQIIMIDFMIDLIKGAIQLKKDSTEKEKAAGVFKKMYLAPMEMEKDHVKFVSESGMSSFFSKEKEKLYLYRRF